MIDLKIALDAYLCLFRGQGKKRGLGNVLEHATNTVQLDWLLLIQLILLSIDSMQSDNNQVCWRPGV